jgi:DNA-binding MarR family transcriptional regulator
MSPSIDQERALPLALRATYLALHRSTDAVLSEYGVTADQFVLMLALREDRALTQRALAERISSDASTVRAMLVLLEKNSLVQRITHPTDSRAKTVELTSAGKRKLQKLWKAGQAIRTSMIGALSPKETAQLIRLLCRLKNSLPSDEQSTL